MLAMYVRCFLWIARKNCKPQRSNQLNQLKTTFELIFKFSIIQHAQFPFHPSSHVSINRFTRRSVVCNLPWIIDHFIDITTIETLCINACDDVWGDFIIYSILFLLQTVVEWRVGKLIWLKIVKSCEFEWWNLARDLKLSEIDTLPPLSFSFIYEYAFNEWMKSSKCVQMSTSIDLRMPYILTFWWGNSLSPSSDADPILLAFTIIVTMINRAIRVCVCESDFINLRNINFSFSSSGATAMMRER